MALRLIDTRPHFRPLSREITAVLRAASPDDWERPTVAGAWRVRDVAAHLIDTALRRLSIHRDRCVLRPIDGDLAAFIDELNATWVRAAQRLSPRVLTELYAETGAQLADFIESLELQAPALLPVSWAGQAQSPQWLDIGREFTEVWHHGSQIRDAVGAGPFPEAQWLRDVLQIAMHALPHAYRDVPGRLGDAVAIRITGPAAGVWNVRRDDSGWVVDQGDVAQPAAAVSMSDEAAWRLFFNALSAADLDARVSVEGDRRLAGPVLRTRSVIVGAVRAT